MQNPFSALLNDLSSRLLQTLDEVIPADRPCALIDYPNHENVGDSAIWAGERQALHRLGRDVAYVADLTAFSARALRRRVGSRGTILLHGGGNLGDLYPHHQRFRERVLRDFGSNAVVIMPQTVSFESTDGLAALKSGLQHPNLVVLLRDRQSLELARSEFDLPCHLAADSAVNLETSYDEDTRISILWLSRTDDESATMTRSSDQLASRPGVRIADWVGKRSSAIPTVALREATLIGGGLASFLPVAARRTNGFLERAYDNLAATRVAYGERLLASADVVVTDRLHAHILAMLVGRPHVLINDRYDKVGRFYRTWSSDHPSVKFADNPQDAWDRAQELLADSRSCSP